MLRATVLGLSLLALAGCTAANTTGSGLRATTHAAAYSCGFAEGNQVEVAYHPGGAWVFLPGRTVHVDRMRSASGAKYEGEGVVWWIKGREAMLETAGITATCTQNDSATPWVDAKLRGADFRAVGNEPGWHLEIHGDAGITLVTGYGTRTVRVPPVAPREEAARTVYHAETEAHDLTVELRPGPCFDDMSGARYATKVTVTVDGQTLRGCGRALH